MNKLAVCLVLVLTLGVAYGLKCYTCDGDIAFLEKGDCGDTFDPEDELLHECNATAGENWCRKEKIGVKGVYSTIERGCASQCEDQNIAYVKRVKCCNTDGCNSAGAITASLLLLGGVTFRAIFM